MNGDEDQFTDDIKKRTKGSPKKDRPMSEPAMMMEDHDGGDHEKKKKGLFSRFKKKKDGDHEEHKKHKKDKKAEAH